MTSELKIGKNYTLEHTECTYLHTYFISRKNHLTCKISFNKGLTFMPIDKILLFLTCDDWGYPRLGCPKLGDLPRGCWGCWVAISLCEADWDIGCCMDGAAGWWFGIIECFCNMALSVVLEISQLVEGEAMVTAEAIGGCCWGGCMDRIIEETDGRCITLLL